MKHPNYTESHKKIVELLEKNNIKNFHGCIQLFADQYDKQWSISVNYNGTGLHIDKKEIDEVELEEDELIQVCKTWLYKDE